MVDRRSASADTQSLQPTQKMNSAILMVRRGREISSKSERAREREREREREGERERGGVRARCVPRRECVNVGVECDWGVEAGCERR